MHVSQCGTELTETCTRVRECVSVARIVHNGGHTPSLRQHFVLHQSVRYRYVQLIVVGHVDACTCTRRADTAKPVEDVRDEAAGNVAVFMPFTPVWSAQ